MEIIKQTKKKVEKAIQTDTQKVNRKIISIFIGSALLIALCVGANAAVQPLTLLSLENSFKSDLNAYELSMTTTRANEEAYQLSIQLTSITAEELCSSYKALANYKDSVKLPIQDPLFNPCTQMRGYAVQFQAPATEVVAEKPATENLKQFKVEVTSYNPSVSQNDSSPCIGASGLNQCELAKKGVKMLALSRELRDEFLEKRADGTYKYPAPVYVESDNPSIHGCYWAVDTLSTHKFKGTAKETAITKQIDLFFMDRKDNQGGTAQVSNKIENCSQEFLNQLS